MPPLNTGAVFDQTQSPSTDLDATTAAPSGAPQADTSTSPAPNPTEPQTMADAIAAAFDSKAFADAATSPDLDGNAVEPPAPAADPDKTSDEDAPGEDKEADATAKTGEEPGTDEAKDLTDPTEAELAGMKPGIRRRVQTLLGQRAAARQEAEEFRGDAGSYRTIRTFMSDNRLQDDEVAELFIIGADLKSGDPTRLKAFVDRVMPRLQMALEATGQALPQDLTGQVDAGEMTEAAARELAQARHERTFAQARTQELETQKTTQLTTEAQATIHSSVLTWHQQTRASDPDFDLKLDVMKRVAQAIVAEKGRPPTPAVALEYAKQAHAEATDMLRKAQPKLSASRPTPTQVVTSASRTNAQPAPSNLADAIGQAFDRAVR